MSGELILKPGFIGVMDQLCNWLNSSLSFKLGFKQGCSCSPVDFHFVCSLNLKFPWHTKMVVISAWTACPQHSIS